MAKKMNKRVVVSDKKLADAFCALQELDVKDYEIFHLGIGKHGNWMVAFAASKKTFYKFLTMVRVEYISQR